MRRKWVVVENLLSGLALTGGVDTKREFLVNITGIEVPQLSIVHDFVIEQRALQNPSSKIIATLVLIFSLR